MKPEDLSGFHVGWDSWTRTSKAGVKVPCVTVTPYPNTVLLYAVYRLLSVYHVSPRLSIQRLARRGGGCFCTNALRRCGAQRSCRRCKYAVGSFARGAANEAAVPLRRSVGQPFLPRGGAGCSFRHLISAPGIRQLLLRRAGRLMTRFFRASRRFFRGARRLCRYMRFYSFDGVFILTKSACCVTI